MKKNNKICKAKKRPEPEGSWPLKIDGRAQEMLFNTSFCQKQCHCSGNICT